MGSINNSIDMISNGGHNTSNQYPPISIPSTPSQNVNQSQIDKQSVNGPTGEKKQLAEQYHSHGYAARKKGDYQTAIQFYSKALEVWPQHFKALFNRGFAYDKLSDFDSAIADYTRAIQIDPRNAYTYYNKGISLDRKGLYDDAVVSFSKAIELEPTKADFFHNRGFAYRKKRDF